MKIDHCCGGFESKIRRVGKILTKYSVAEDFKEWTFGQLSLCLCDYWTFSHLNLDQSHIFKKRYLLHTFRLRTFVAQPPYLCLSEEETRLTEDSRHILGKSTAKGN